MFKKPLNLVIQPTYRCNKNCPFCLYGQFKNNTETLSLSELENILDYLSRSFEIKTIKISGGEISILGEFYIDLLLRLCKLYTKDLQIFTNLKSLNKIILNNCDSLNVSLNFNKYDADIKETIENIKVISNKKSINIKTLDRSCKDNTDKIIDLLNSLNIKSWEIIPYHHTEFLPFKSNSYSNYELVVEQYLRMYREMKFSFLNKLQLEGIYKKDNYNTPVIYITPNNKIAMQVFDNANNFSLKELEDYTTITESYVNYEKSRDNYCSKCTSKLKCLTNYFFNTNYTGPSCSGGKDFISYHKN